MALSHYPLSKRPDESPHTLVVLPKAPPVHSSALWALFWAIGVMMGLLGRELVIGGDGSALSNGGGLNGVGQVVAEAGSPTPLAVEVRAVLELPTATATWTPPPMPTSTPATPEPAEFCSAEKPGEVCRVPYPPPPTATPFPSCKRMALLNPGDWCVWPTPVPSATARSSGVASGP